MTTILAALILVTLLAIAAILVVLARGMRAASDVGAPRAQRVVLTDVDDDSYEGFLVLEDAHRLVLEAAFLLQGEGRKVGMAGRQHFRVARVKRVQELSEAQELPF